MYFQSRQSGGLILPKLNTFEYICQAFIHVSSFFRYWCIGQSRQTASCFQMLFGFRLKCGLYMLFSRVWLLHACYMQKGTMVHWSNNMIKDLPDDVKQLTTEKLSVSVSRECFSDFFSAVASIFHFYKIPPCGTLVEMLQPFPQTQK